MSFLTTISKERIQTMVESGMTDVFRTMLQKNLSLDGSSSLEDDEPSGSPLSELDETLVVGNVGFVGHVSGMVYLAMPERVAVNIAVYMLGMDREDIEGENEMINDVIGEITNMSAGAYKNQMADLGYPCRLTIPSIIRGKYFVVEAAKATYRKLFVFQFEDDLISFELIMKEDLGAAE